MKIRLMLLLVLVGMSLGLLATPIDLTIFFTTDTHHRLITPEGGWLRLATLLKQEIRQSGGPDRVLLIDCGDTLQGTIGGILDHGKAVIQALNHLRYDVWVIGNHDIEFGFPTLRQRAAEFQGAAMAGNLRLPGGPGRLQSWKIIERNGLKIAIIGLTLPNMKDDVRLPEAERGQSFDFAETLQRLMPEVRRSNPDLIILAGHCGKYAKDYNAIQLSKLFPEINLIFGGHSHQDLPGEKVGTAWYAQAGCHAKSLGRLKLTYDPELRRILQVSSALLPADTAAPAPELQQILQPALQHEQEFRNRVVGYTTAPLEARTPAREFSYQSGLLQAKAMQESAKTDAALISVNPNLALNGKITEDDLFQLMAYENTLCTVKLTARELETVLQEQLHMKKSYYSPILYGIRAYYNGRHQLVGPLRDLQGNSIAPDRKLTLAVSNFLLMSSHFPVLQKIAAQSPPGGSQSDRLLVRDILRNYLRKHSPVSPNLPEGLQKDAAK